jgi:hypothetical protein
MMFGANSANEDGLSVPINHRSVRASFNFLACLDLNDSHEDEGRACIDAMKQTEQVPSHSAGNPRKGK